MPTADYLEPTIEAITREVGPGDDGYDVIKAAWETEGRPGQFERWGNFGGRLYLVLNRKTDNPTFLVHVADGPTEFEYEYDTGESSERGAVTRKGYLWTFNRGDGFAFRLWRGKWTVAHYRDRRKMEND